MANELALQSTLSLIEEQILMLYLLHAAGYVEELPAAVSAEIEEQSRCLICRDESGKEVARYPFLAITMYSTRPLPVQDTATRP